LRTPYVAHYHLIDERIFPVVHTRSRDLPYDSTEKMYHVTMNSEHEFRDLLAIRDRRVNRLCAHTQTIERKMGKCARSTHTRPRATPIAMV
jgi:hypothetical protein